MHKAGLGHSWINSLVWCSRYDGPRSSQFACMSITQFTQHISLVEQQTRKPTRTIVQTGNAWWQLALDFRLYPTCTHSTTHLNYNHYNNMHVWISPQYIQCIRYLNSHHWPVGYNVNAKHWGSPTRNWNPFHETHTHTTIDRSLMNSAQQHRSPCPPPPSNGVSCQFALESSTTVPRFTAFYEQKLCKELGWTTALTLSKNSPLPGMNCFATILEIVATLRGPGLFLSYARC